jgi:hypothetical protein
MRCLSFSRRENDSGVIQRYENEPYDISFGSL